ncbi:hypothetical protein BGZ65_008235, partial [Modicella reniformis]
MSSTHPLQLPEIIQEVANFVEDPSLRACALVSKTWYQVFHPLIWSDVRFRLFQHNPPNCLLHLGHLVKTFTITFNFNQQHLALRFPHLISLTAVGHP